MDSLYLGLGESSRRRHLVLFNAGRAINDKNVYGKGECPVIFYRSIDVLRSENDAVFKSSRLIYPLRRSL